MTRLSRVSRTICVPAAGYKRGVTGGASISEERKHNSAASLHTCWAAHRPHIRAINVTIVVVSVFCYSV
jgi:hypothetical protein